MVPRFAGFSRKRVFENFAETCRKFPPAQWYRDFPDSPGNGFSKISRKHVENCEIRQLFVKNSDFLACFRQIAFPFNSRPVVGTERKGGTVTHFASVNALTRELPSCRLALLIPISLPLYNPVVGVCKVNKWISQPMNWFAWNRSFGQLFTVKEMYSA